MQYPVKRQIYIQQTHVQQYVFMSTETYHIIQYLAGVHMENPQMCSTVPRTDTAAKLYTHNYIVLLETSTT